MRLGRDGRSHVELIERIAQHTSAARDGDEALLSAVSAICTWTGFPPRHPDLAGRDPALPLPPPRPGCRGERDPGRPLPPSGLGQGAGRQYAPLIELTADTPLAPGIGLPG